LSYHKQKKNCQNKLAGISRKNFKIPQDFFDWIFNKKIRQITVRYQQVKFQI